jgi:hypothetical protein
MLDILDKSGKVVAVIMDDGTVVKKAKSDDDINTLVRQQIEKMQKGK